MSSSLSTIECSVKCLVEILHDHLRRVVVGDVVVPTLADRDAIEQVLAIVQRLAQLQHPVFVAGELDAKRFPHHTRTAVAADEIGRSDFRGFAGEVLHRRRHAVGVLAERDEFMAVAHGDARQRLRHRFQERLERVLRDQLVWLERQRAIVGRRDLRLERRHRRILLVQQRRLDDVPQHDENVHRYVGRKPHRADAIRQPHAPVDLHRARIGALHLRQEQRRFLLLDQNAADAAHAEVDREGQTRRAGAGDENLGFHAFLKSHNMGFVKLTFFGQFQRCAPSRPAARSLW